MATLGPKRCSGPSRLPDPRPALRRLPKGIEVHEAEVLDETSEIPLGGLTGGVRGVEDGQGGTKAAGGAELPEQAELARRAVQPVGTGKAHGIPQRP